MIRAWQYRHAVDGKDRIALDEIGAARGGPGTLVLVDADQPSVDELRTLAADLPIHPLAVEDLENANQRTKLEPYGDHWHVALHAFEIGRADIAVREIDLVWGEDWLLVVRQPGEDGDAHPIDEALVRFERARRDPKADDIGFALWAVIDAVVDGYFTITDRVDERLDDIEEIVFDGGRRDEIPHEIFDLRRSLVRFRRQTAPLREVLNEILRAEVPCITGEALVRLRDVYDHSLRIADLVESQRDLLTGLLEAHLAVASNRMSDVMKKTSSWGALILVPSLIAGIYGMNFSNMFLQEANFGYPVLMVIMVAITAALWVFFRRRNWL